MSFEVTNTIPQRYCILCNTLGVLVSVGEKGIQSLKQAAIARAEEDRALHCL